MGRGNLRGASDDHQGPSSPGGPDQGVAYDTMAGVARSLPPALDGNEPVKGSWVGVHGM